MCFFAASATASSGETASSGDKTLRLARGSDIQTMDVHKASSGYCIPMNIFERLFESKLNDNGRTEQPVLRPCGDRMAARHRAGELECDRKIVQQNSAPSARNHADGALFLTEKAKNPVRTAGATLRALLFLPAGRDDVGVLSILGGIGAFQHPFAEHLHIRHDMLTADQLAARLCHLP